MQLWIINRHVIRAHMNEVLIVLNNKATYGTRFIGKAYWSRTGKYYKEQHHVTRY